jgi:hypothetical protein
MFFNADDLRDCKLKHRKKLASQASQGLLQQIVRMIGCHCRFFFDFNSDDIGACRTNRHRAQILMLFCLCSVYTSRTDALGKHYKYLARKGLQGSVKHFRRPMLFKCFFVSVTLAKAISKHRKYLAPRGSQRTALMIGQGRPSDRTPELFRSLSSYNLRDGT